MIFTPPSWLPAIEQDLSKVGTVGDFALQGTLGNASGPRVDEPTFISASTQKERTPAQIAQNVEALAAGLAHELQWSPNAPAQGGKVIAILSENTVDYLVYCWAVHRLRGTCLLLHGTTSPQENAKHLQRSDCRTLLVSPALLQSGRAAAAAASTSEAGIRVYLTERVATDSAQGNVNGNSDTDLKTLEELVSFGKTLSPLPALDWSPEEAQSSIAYLCATSGTSGVQRLARLSHRGIILNILQVSALESTIRHRDVEIVLGVLPLSHVQGVIASHGTVYFRDRLILHTTFDMKAAMMSIQTYRINRLYLVPSVLAALVGNQFLFKIFDLSSVDTVYVGAGSLSSELYAKTKAVQPSWNLVNGYGLTESSMVVAMSSSQEPGPGPVGILLPLYQARLRREDGSDVEAFDEPGELLLSSPNQASGYIGDEEAATATFRDGWLHTGDVAIFRQSPRGDSHLYIVDRLRDMIKVKGMQVSPVAIEECLRQHPGVADVAVIGVPDNVAGERAKAFVVLMKNPDPTAKPADPETLFEQWDEHVQSKLTEPHWLRGRYELLEALPRNTSGKVAKGLLRAM